MLRIKEFFNNWENVFCLNVDFTGLHILNIMFDNSVKGGIAKHVPLTRT